MENIEMYNRQTSVYSQSQIAISRRNIKNTSIKFLASIIVFIYIFNPRFIPLELRKLIDLASIIVIFFHYLNNPINSNKNNKCSNVLLFFFGYLILGTMACILFSFSNMSIYITNAYEIISTFLRSFLVAKAFILVLKKYGFGWDEYIEIFSLTGCIQLICVIVAFISPQIKSIFNAFTITNSKSAYVAFSTKYNNYRSYGLAENLFDSFGYTISLVILLTFISGLFQKNTKKVVLSFSMIIMPLLNARTGVVLTILGMIVSFLIYSKSSVTQTLKIVTILFVATLVGGFSLNYIPTETKEWILEGSSSIFDLFFSHNTTGIFSILSNQYIFPNNIILGAFGSPEMFRVGHSDVGYIQCIWRYGLLGSSLLLIGFFKLLIEKGKQGNNDQLKTFIVCLVIMLIVYLYKMYPFTNIGSNFIIFICLMNGKTRIEKNEK